MRGRKRQRKKSVKKLNKVMKEVWQPFIADAINDYCSLAEAFALASKAKPKQK